MKQKDIILIIVIVFISGVSSLILSNMLITAPKNRQEEVEVVPPITADFETPSPNYFNNDSINPTQEIQIGNEDNKNPL